MAHTPNYCVFEFWRCVLHDPKKVSQISEHLYPSINEHTFDILKKKWYTYDDPFVRSSFFYILNRCSKLGMISHGELDKLNYNSMALRDLNNFKVDNLHVNLLKNNDIQNYDDNLNIINVGKYRISFLENEQVLGEEEAEINQTTLIKELKQKKTIFIFKFHPALLKLSDYDITLIDKYGRITKKTDFAEEVLLHNV